MTINPSTQPSNVPTRSCDNFHFNDGWFVVVALITSFIILYIICDFIFNKKCRVIPSMLMLGRAICDAFCVFIVLYLIETDRFSGCGERVRKKGCAVFALYIILIFCFKLKYIE